LKVSALIHYHELSIKGNNRPYFEKKFLNNIKVFLRDLKYGSIEHKNARVIVDDIDPHHWTEYRKRFKSLVGLANCTLVLTSSLNIEDIKKNSILSINNKEFSSFKIHSRRNNKNFKYTSPEINSIVGEYVRLNTNKSVRLNNPDITIYIEIVDDRAFIGWDRLKGFGGLPSGSCETALSLISSGIDSPVASFEMIKRGVQVDFIHFHSAPATTIESKDNVEQLVQHLCNFQPYSTLMHIPILEIQQTIMKLIPEKLWVIFFRREMIKIASIVANKKKINALITGESIGQVASQTLSNLRSISEVSTLPILRPLSGSNKEEIINRAIDIGTYDISIKPYQDCCSFFIPNHPETKSKINVIRNFDKKLNLTQLTIDSINKSEVKEFFYENK